MPSLKEMLRAGARPENWTARNRPFLATCKNRRPTDDGLKSFFSFAPQVSDSAITTASESKAWPYPMVFEGKSIWLLAFEDVVYVVDPSDGSIALLDTKDPADETGGTSKAIDPGRDWHFLDMGNSWMLFNGVSVVWQKHGGFAWTTSDVTIVTGCVHKEGRALLAGFNADNYFAIADWPAYWTELGNTMPDDYASVTEEGLAENHVWWSSFLAPDLFQLVDPDPLMDSGMALDLRIRREAGSCRLPWNGACIGMAEFGDGVIAYGTGGINFLRPVNRRYAVEEFPQLGTTCIEVAAGDSSTRTHFAGTKAVQYFVDGGFALWRLTPDLKAELIGHAEQLSTLSRATMIVTYDSANDGLYIADGTRCWLYQNGRMCEAPVMPSRITAGGRHSLRSIAFDATDPSTATVETGTVTTATGLVETLALIWFKGLTTSGSDGWRVKVKYRLRIYDDWRETDWYTPDARGHVTGLALPVLEFRIVLESTDQSKVSAEDLGYEFGDTNPAFAGVMATATPGPATE